MSNHSLLRHLRIGLWGLLIATGLWTAWLVMPVAPPLPQSSESLGQGSYRLQTTEGQPFTSASLIGQPSLVFFGFTHCPDVCPTTMADIAGWKEDLGPLGDDLKVWFITVDPNRDTADILRAYLSWIPGANGVTGDPAELRKALEAFSIAAREVTTEDGGYAVDHSAPVLLFDQNGRNREIFTYQEAADQVISALRRVLEEQG